MIWVIEVRNGCKGWMMSALREPVWTREQARISLAAIKRDYPGLEFRIRKYARQEP